MSYTLLNSNHFKPVLIYNFILIFISLYPINVNASGSYVARLTRPPTSIIIDKYQLGKQVFVGKVSLGDYPTLKKTQNIDLLKLQSKLPKRAKIKTKLPALAGKINFKEMEALIYYLKIRFHISLDTNKAR